MPWSDIAGAPTLLQEFLNHAQGDSETVGNVGPGALVVVIGSQDSFAQIQRERSHAQEANTTSTDGYTIYLNALASLPPMYMIC